MPPATDAGSVKDAMVDEVVLCFDRLEELVPAVTSDLHDVKAQQTALRVSLIRLEQQASGPGDGASTAHAANSHDSPPSARAMRLSCHHSREAVRTPIVADHQTATSSTPVRGTPPLRTRSNSPNLMALVTQCHGLTAVSATSGSAVLRRTSACRWPPSISSTTPRFGTIALNSTGVTRHGHGSSSSSTRALGHP
jgi:hypothetical protein